MEDKQKTVVVESKEVKKNRTPLISGIVGGVVLLVIVILLIIHFTHHKGPVTTSSPTISRACTSPAAGNDLGLARQNFSVSKTAQLGAIVDSIKQLPDYQKDPNCLYILTMYSVYTNNLTNAQKYLAEFNSLYRNGELSQQFVGIGGVENLQASVTGLENVQKEESRHLGSGLKQ